MILRGALVEMSSGKQFEQVHELFIAWMQEFKKPDDAVLNVPGE